MRISSQGNVLSRQPEIWACFNVAAGALGCGGLLMTLAMGTGHDVRRLERLPIVRSIAGEIA